MNTKIVKQLVKIANILDANGYHNEADTLTKVAQFDPNAYTDPNVAKLRDAVLKDNSLKSVFYFGDIVDSASAKQRISNILTAMNIPVNNATADKEALKEIFSNPKKLNDFSKAFAKDRLIFLKNKLESEKGNEGVAQSWKSTDILNREIAKLKNYLGYSQLEEGKTTGFGQTLKGESLDLNEIVSRAAIKVLRNAGFEKDETLLALSLRPAGRNRGWRWLQTGDGTQFGGPNVKPQQYQQQLLKEIEKLVGPENYVKRDKAWAIASNKVGIPLQQIR